MSYFFLHRFLCCFAIVIRGVSLHWCHNDLNGVSSLQPHGCLLNRLFRRRSKKTSKLRVTGLCAGNSPGTGDFPAQMASNAENVSIWWRHHATCGDISYAVIMRQDPTTDGDEQWYKKSNMQVAVLCYVMIVVKWKLTITRPGQKLLALLITK